MYKNQKNSNSQLLFESVATIELLKTKDKSIRKPKINQTNKQTPRSRCMMTAAAIRVARAEFIEAPRPRDSNRFEKFAATLQAYVS